MPILAQVLFVVMLLMAIWLFSKKAGQIRRNILLGRPDALNDHPDIRWRNLVLLALGQKKMFKNPMVALLHLFVYAGFIIINFEVLEIILDGILGTHRLFLPLLGPVYNWLLNGFEFLAITVLTVCMIFLVRRNILRLKRLSGKDLNGWPKSDANYILITEIILMSLFLKMNACDQVLQSRGEAHFHATGPLYISEMLMPLLRGYSSETLILFERICWWMHIAGILAFLNYLPYSKHLHILLAFPNAYYARLKPLGQMKNMDAVQQEVLYAMQPELAPADAPTPGRFGAKDVFDLSWKSLLDAYSCTECGRCTAACPANITGKLLSPRKIMMSTRDRLEEVGRNINQHTTFKEDQKSLLHDYISVEELRACTTCNACVDACPVSISPLDIILELRRTLIMEESNAPQEWNSTFSNMENNFAPWKFSPDDRDLWTKELN